MKPLANAKHEAFARAIVLGKSGREAYRAAGYGKCTAKAADVAASRLLKNAKVAARVAELKEAAADDTVMSAREVLEELSKVGRANVADHLRAFAYADNIVGALDQLTPEQTAALGEVTVEQYMEGSGEDARPVRRTKFRMHSKNEALKLLGQHHKLFTEKKELDVADPLKKLLEELSGNAFRPKQ